MNPKDSSYVVDTAIEMDTRLRARIAALEAALRKIERLTSWVSRPKHKSEVYAPDNSREVWEIARAALGAAKGANDGQ